MEQMLLGLGKWMPKLWEMSLAGGLVILVVLGARGVLYRAPKIFSYALWSVVLFRLLCPVSISTPVSVFRLFETPQNEAVYTLPMENGTGMSEVPAELWTEHAEKTVAGGQTQAEAPDTEITTQSIWTQKSVRMGVIWLVGMLCVLVYGSRGCVSLRKSLRHAERLRQDVYETDRIRIPFVWGLISPKIYLPVNLSEEEREYIILHERTHVGRGDHISRLLFFAAAAIHWFNPLVWAAFYLSEKDMEMSCDETVLRAMDEDIRAAYATSLLRLAVGKTRFAGIPLAFGESDTKARVKNIMRYRKPAAGVAAAAAFLVGLLLVALGSNPKEQEPAGTEEIHKEQETQVQEALKEQEAQVQELLKAEEAQREAAARELAAYEAVNKWAEAFCSRDAETIADMCGENAMESLAESVAFETHEGQSVMGYSSPWPWGGETDYEICLVTDSKAEILYYAWTSDPHVTVWRETLNYHEENGKYVVDEEKLFWMDYISSGAEYMQAYPKGVTGSRMNYLTNEAGTSLNENAKENPNFAGYAELFAPETAARYLLNLLDNPNKVLLTAEAAQTDGSVPVEIQFLEDGVRVRVNMRQPYGSDGIWIVNGDVMPAEDDSAADSIQNGSYEIGVRTLSVENRCIETYVRTNSPDSRICVTPIYFAEDCVFRISQSVNTSEDEEVDLEEFAAAIAEDTPEHPQRCRLTMQDGSAVEVKLLAADEP